VVCLSQVGVVGIVLPGGWQFGWVGISELVGGSLGDNLELQAFGTHTRTQCCDTWVFGFRINISAAANSVISSLCASRSWANFILVFSISTSRVSFTRLSFSS
jgi:hypothetical protein